MTEGKRFKVVITDHDYGNQDLEHKILDDIADIRAYQLKNLDDVLEEVLDIDGLLVEYARVTRKAIERCKNLRVISRYGIGYDSVDVQAATEHNIIVCNVPDFCMEEVANHTIALILSLVRKVVFLDRSVKTMAWDLSLHKPVYALRNLTLGLVGFGNLARNVVNKMKVFGIKMIASDPYVPAEIFDEFGVDNVDLDDLLEQADIVSINSALTKDTFHLIGSREFGLMREEAMLVNTSRGAIIDEKALCAALKSKTISAAAIDVVEDEPIARDHELLTLENVIITPHVSFYSEASVIELQTRAATAVLDVLEGREPRNVVNKEVLEKLI